MSTLALYNDFNSYLHHMNSIISLADIKNNNRRDIVIGSLFAKILDYSNGIRVLFNGKSFNSAECLARSCMEALFYMGACINNEVALNNFYGRDNYYKLKYINVVLINKDFREVNYDELELIRLKGEIVKSNEKEGYIEFNTERAAQLAGLTSMYNTRYRIHSEADHSSPRYLEDTYLVHDGINILGIKILPSQESTVKRILETMTPVLALSCDWYRKLYKIDDTAEIRQIDAKYIRASE